MNGVSTAAMSRAAISTGRSGICTCKMNRPGFGNPPVTCPLSLLHHATPQIVIDMDTTPFSVKS